jgi:mycothiol S-conjugate amidase
VQADPREGAGGTLGRVSDRCILTVHAHPDDEASKGAPTLRMYHERGVRTVLVCCTGGEEGDLQNPGLREPGQPFHGLAAEDEKALVARLRPAELDESARIIGFDRVVMLGYRDSGMAGTEPNDDPRSFNKAPIDEAVARLVAVIRAERPQVVLTYNDDHTGYPHPDHVRTHEISVLAYDRAADPSWRADLGRAHQVDKLYYTIWSRARMQAVHEAMLRLRGSSPYNEEWFARRPDQHERITTRLDVGCYLWARSAALRAHATQVDPTESHWFGLADDELAAVYPYEDWELARSAVGFPADGEIETDLFAGVGSPAEARP